MQDTADFLDSISEATPAACDSGHAVPSVSTGNLPVSREQSPTLCLCSGEAIGTVALPMQCSPAAPPPVDIQKDTLAFHVLDCDGAIYPNLWMSRCHQYLGPDGALYIKMPTIHRATGQLVYVISPAVNSCAASILRNMPELMAYRPIVPKDLDWATQLVKSVPLQVSGIALQNPSAHVHEVNFT